MSEEENIWIYFAFHLFTLKIQRINSMYFNIYHIAKNSNENVDLGEKSIIVLPLICT